MERIQVLIKQTAKDLPLPEYQSAFAAGVDLRAAVDGEFILEPRKRALVPTGIHISVPQGFEAQIRPRSGNALKYGISMVNSVGTIDSDYRGEIKVLLINHGEEPFIIKRGDRIAQLILNRIAQARFERVEELDTTVRGEGLGNPGTHVRAQCGNAHRLRKRSNEVTVRVVISNRALVLERDFERLKRVLDGIVIRNSRATEGT